MPQDVELRLVGRLASALAGMGVRPGDTVGVNGLLSNAVETAWRFGRGSTIVDLRRIVLAALAILELLHSLE